MIDTYAYAETIAHLNDAAKSISQASNSAQGIGLGKPATSMKLLTIRQQIEDAQLMLMRLATEKDAKDAKETA